MIKNVMLTGIASVNFRIKKPAQLVKGPGKTGKKLPMTPRTINRKEITIKKMSIMEIKSVLSLTLS